MVNQKHSTPEHNQLVELAIKYFKGEEVIIRGNSNIRGKYFPDVVTKDTDIECELLKNSYLAKKVIKWNKQRKKILVLGLPKVALDNFDEVYVINSNKELQKIIP